MPTNLTLHIPVDDYPEAIERLYKLGLKWGIKMPPYYEGTSGNKLQNGKKIVAAQFLAMIANGDKRMFEGIK